MKNQDTRKKIEDVFTSARNAQVHLSGMNNEQKNSLEKEWDVEHAYYSSTLEGSQIDKKDFEKAGKKIM